MKTGPEFKVGLTVLVAGVLLTAGIMWGTGYRPHAETTPLTVTFRNVYGIGVDGPVTIGGVRAGTVTAVRLQDGMVHIDAELNGRVTLPADSRILVKSDGLMGGRFIAIELGTAAEPMDLSQPVSGTIESGVNDVMGAAGAMMGKLERTVDAMERLLGNGKIEASLDKSLRDIERTVADLSRLVRDNRGRLDTAIGDFSRGARVLGEAVDGREADLKKAVGDFVAVSGRSRTVMARLDTLTGTLDGIAGRVKRGEGTLGRMVNSDELYRRLLEGVGRLDSLAADVKRNPGKYTKGIKLEIF